MAFYYVGLLYLMCSGKANSSEVSPAFMYCLSSNCRLYPLCAETRAINIGILFFESGILGLINLAQEGMVNNTGPDLHPMWNGRKYLSLSGRQ